MPSIAKKCKRPDNRPARERYRNSQRGYKKHEDNILSRFEILKKKYPGKYNLIKRDVKCSRGGDTRTVYQIIKTDVTYRKDRQGVMVRER